MDSCDAGALSLLRTVQKRRDIEHSHSPGRTRRNKSRFPLCIVFDVDFEVSEAMTKRSSKLHRFDD